MLYVEVPTINELCTINSDRSDFRSRRQIGKTPFSTLSQNLISEILNKSYTQDLVAKATKINVAGGMYLLVKYNASLGYNEDGTKRDNSPPLAPRSVSSFVVALGVMFGILCLAMFIVALLFMLKR